MGLIKDGLNFSDSHVMVWFSCVQMIVGLFGCCFFVFVFISDQSIKGYHRTFVWSDDMFLNEKILKIGRFSVEI